MKNNPQYRDPSEPLIEARRALALAEDALARQDWAEFRTALGWAAANVKESSDRAEAKHRDALLREHYWAARRRLEEVAPAATPSFVHERAEVAAQYNADLEMVSFYARA